MPDIPEILLPDKEKLKHRFVKSHEPIPKDMWEILLEHAGQRRTMFGIVLSITHAVGSFLIVSRGDIGTTAFNAAMWKYAPDIIDLMVDDKKGREYGRMLLRMNFGDESS